MLVILYHLKNYCNMLLPYLTTSTVLSSLEMPITTFPALRKPNVCALFEGQTPCFLYLELNIIFANMTICIFHWHFITKLFYVKYQHCKSQFNAQSMALFNGLGTINEKCYCSHTLCIVSQKCCAGEQGRCCAVLKLGKFHKPNCILPTHYRKTRTTFPVPIPSF